MKALPLLPTLHYEDYMLLSCFTQFLFLCKVRKVFCYSETESMSPPLPADTRVQLTTRTVGTGEVPAHTWLAGGGQLKAVMLTGAFHLTQQD